MIILLIELRIVLDQMGLDPSEEELEDMIREVDEDQSGSISFIEFVGKEKKIKNLLINKSQCLDMIKKAVDTNKTSREELFRAFQVFGIEKDFKKRNINGLLLYE